MREIKFRAWDKKKKEMVSHDMLFSLDCSNEYPFLPLLKNMYSYKFDVEIMQYTGLKDMYEGDLHKIEGNWPVYEVVFNEKTASFGLKSPTGPFYSFEELNKRGAVLSEKLGTRYENPELLKGESL